MAGGFASALGAAILQGSRGYRERKLQDEDLRRQREADERAKEMHALNAAILKQQQADIPRQQAKDKLSLLQQLQGELAYSNPEFLAAAESAGAPLRVSQTPQLDRAKVLEGNIASAPIQQIGTNMRNYGQQIPEFAEGTGAQLPPELVAAREQRDRSARAAELQIRSGQNQVDSFRTPEQQQAWELEKIKAQGDQQVRAAGVRASAQGALTPAQLETKTRSLRNDWNRFTGATQTMRMALNQAEAGLDFLKKTGDAEQAGIMIATAFAKIQDPQSVVREAEYDRIAGGLSLVNRFLGAWERLSKGGTGIPGAELQTFVDAMRQMVAKENEVIENKRLMFEEHANEFGINPALVFGKGENTSSSTTEETAPAGIKPGDSISYNDVVARAQQLGEDPKALAQELMAEGVRILGQEQAAPQQQSGIMNWLNSTDHRQRNRQPQTAPVATGQTSIPISAVRAEAQRTGQDVVKLATELRAQGVRIIAGQ